MGAEERESGTALSQPKDPGEDFMRKEVLGSAFNKLSEIWFQWYKNPNHESQITPPYPIIIALDLFPVVRTSR